MILPPLNDRECLDLLHEEVRRRVRHPVYVGLAQAFHTPEEIAAFIRSRPLELDHGSPLDGPRLACIPSQRLRHLPEGINCFESTAMYMPLAEIIDPSTPRTSCTIRVGRGYHTFPVDQGQAVILDPELPPRNAMDAGIYTCQRRNGLRPTILQAGEARPWLLRVAANAARTPIERTAVRTAVHALNRSLYHGEPLVDLHALATAIALAETEAPLWGEDGTHALAHATCSLRNLQQRIDLGAFAGLARRIGQRALEGYILSQTGPLGLVLIEAMKGPPADRPAPTPPDAAQTQPAAAPPERSSSAGADDPLRAMTL